MSARYLIQNSEVILIGDVVGEVGTGRRNLEGNLEGTYLWMTYWKVRVDYYLKGTEESSEFIVVTPGAKGKSAFTSIDFRLDESGGTVMLFLQQRGKLFEPITPQGIVTLRKTGYVRKKGEPVKWLYSSHLTEKTGQRVFNQIIICYNDHDHADTSGINLLARIYAVNGGIFSFSKDMVIIYGY